MNRIEVPSTSDFTKVIKNGKSRLHLRIVLYLMILSKHKLIDERQLRFTESKS